ncbi:444_t:CDS:2 [Paraglomus brasilianum]|uniref:444_t:CDS:1 n=1 Tax=Paraglomus brasilianum TaxID=144538 RepID=A0A9N9H1B4_9GLOM|nr:444_t:CDS:2 [Paraglomus brasilianum]
MRSPILYFTLTFLFASAMFSNAAYNITTPGTGVIWHAFDAVQVLWTGTDEPNVDVRLVSGPAENLTQFTVLCTDVPSSVGLCNYTVDENIPSGINYAVTVGKLPENYAFSSYFSIQTKDPLPANTGCPNFGGYNCTQTFPCCSASGYCGATEGHCGTGCVPQFSFNGICGIPTPPAPPTTK